jgi:dATP/dGTP diphosphohydrolase
MSQEAKRNPQNLRYDILDPLFLEHLARIADYGAKKYGDLNWHQSHLEGDKSAINHIYKHLKSFRLEEPYDHQELGSGKEWHLAAIAFNAMMEFYWVMKEKKLSQKDLETQEKAKLDLHTGFKLDSIG